MAERTSSTQTVTRKELADALRDLADAFESEETRITVGNKSVKVSPSSELTYSIDVVERSALLRGRRETVEIELGWKPASADNE